ncbi:zinc-dependent alcohol dehydrogenase family protein [Micromonospora sp. RHAY321]|uniref:zinc-dependent alcohol dehydrogenase family protein n=1 Tax=Micromonospora sp. RHAY321 TaxID=2944807 RepID=UPI00207C9363|nr:zinc-dependent alcohol dehydrogenase family protein [Micromonospora sp. RHAY321]MCO1596968.1 zinc-dependent alcohol dehydrogenase family protein [Micromonospora sp. RHAY321]
MRAVIFDQFGVRPEVRDVPDPVPPPGGAVIRVEATGLCRSDWHGWQGHDPDVRPPHVPGHEFAGVVAEVGAGVRGWRRGDRVTAPFVCACGQCPACLAGDQQVCERQTQPGFTHWGSFAEYVSVHDADVNLVRLPDELGHPAAAALGCRFATAFRAVVSQGRVAAGEWVAVHGCGGVGLSAVMIAAACGAQVVAVDIAPAALDLARSFGATVCLDGSTLTDPGAVAAAVREATGGGAHLSLDALGSHATCIASVECLRRRGRHVQVGLLPAVQGRPALPMDLVIAYELELRGSHGMAAHAYPELLRLVTAGVLRPAELITRTIGLDAVPHALATMDRPGHGGMCLIHPR